MRHSIGYSGILPLADACDEPLVGGKAAGLSRLIQLGVQVPRGVVITTAETSRFEADRIPTNVWQRIVIAWRSLQASTVIVRSSAVGEDSADASFAGQLESIPDVRDEDGLRAALLRCHASGESERVTAYERSRAHTLAGLAIVIQAQINSRVSGVLFTVDPRGSDAAVIEYCAGAGEALVSGRVNPGRVLVDGTSRVHHAAAADGAVLDDKTAREIAAQGLRIAAAMGSPQDIEWTIDAAGQIWIVQTRPITASAASHSASPSVVWSNANVNENFPDPISPLLYSLASEGYYHYFRNLGYAFGLAPKTLASIEEPLRQIIGVHAGRMYYNLTSIHRVLRAAPFGEQLAAAFNQFVGTNEVTPRDARRSRLAARDLWRAARIACAVAWQYALLPRRVAEFERTVDAFADSTHPSKLPRLGREALLQRLRAFREIRCRRWKNASLADTAAMVTYAALKILLRRSLPREDQEALHNTLLKALPDLVSGRPAVELWKLSRAIRSNERLAGLFAESDPAVVIATIRREPEFTAFRGEIDAYVEAWGFRCSAELMLTVPSFQENPAALVPILRAYATSAGESPEDQLSRQRDARIRETRRILRALSIPRALVLRALLPWTQRSIQFRERARLKQALLYSRLRRVALAIGRELVADGRVETAEDVFMLTAEELEQLLAGASMFPDHVRALTQLRRDAHRSFAEQRPAETLVLPRGSYVTAAPCEEASISIGTNALTGTSACGGRSTGRATVLADVGEAHRLAAGDILVTRQTDPGWGPVFPLISGLIMERGGMLSHGAIIAREFGIPSIVGVNNATRLIPSGSLVCLDGDRGIVRLVAEGV
jgi:rifampicin phosphotransferase